MVRLLQRWLFLVVAVALIGGCAPAAHAPRMHAGVLDLRGWDFAHRAPAALNGEWDFYWGRLVDGAQGAPAATESFKLPGTWNGHRLSNGRSIPGTGYATLHARVLLPADAPARLKLSTDQANSAYRLFVRDASGRLLAAPVAAGRVSDRPEDSRADYRAGTVAFAATGSVDVYLQISSWQHPRGGTNASLLLAEATRLDEHLESRHLTEFFLLGAIFIMGLYHIALYLMRRQETAPLWFGLFCLMVALRTYMAGLYLQRAFPQADLWWLYHRAEYVGVHLCIPFFLLFFQSLFRPFVQRRVIQAYTALFAGLVAVVLVTPSVVYSHTLPILHLTVLPLIPLVLFWLIRAIVVTRHLTAWLLLAGILALAFGTAHDIVRDMGLIESSYLLHVANFAFIFSQTLVLAVLNQQARTQSEVYATELGRLNQAYSRFVPQEFLRFLSKRSITEVQLGDQVQREMSILFSDIRSFTTLSEQLTPAETFNFLNSYLKRMGPVVTRHGGFIDKYIGDAIMALFPERPEDALETAIAMQAELGVYNQHRATRGYQPIAIGIGIHTGSMMLGTIGEHNRLEGTVISDAVNLASRLEGLTKLYGAPLLVSQDAVEKLDDPGRYAMRFLDVVQVKGKLNKVAIYEVFQADEPAVRAGKQASRALFEAAVHLFLRGETTEAEERFEQLARTYPDDRPVRYYLTRCRSDRDATERLGLELG